MIIKIKKPKVKKITFTEPFDLLSLIMKMGKYKGWKIKKVPNYYLHWMLDELDLPEAYVKIIRFKLKQPESYAEQQKIKNATSTTSAREKYKNAKNLK